MVRGRLRLMPRPPGATLHLHLLAADIVDRYSARCMDGSPGGFYCAQYSQTCAMIATATAKTAMTTSTTREKTKNETVGSEHIYSTLAGFPDTLCPRTSMLENEKMIDSNQEKMGTSMRQLLNTLD